MGILNQQEDGESQRFSLRGTFPVFLYGFLSILSLFLMYFLGTRQGTIFTDPILSHLIYQPFAGIAIIVILNAMLSRYPTVQVYLVGALMVAYAYIAAAVLPNFSLFIFPLISLVLSFMLALRIDLNRKSRLTRIGMFVSVSIFMLILGGALRFYNNPAEFTIAFGSIYDDENPLGVPFLFYNGIVIYSRFLVVTVSIPIILMFAGLAAVLTENYHLIVGYTSSRRIAGIGRNFNSALTVLSCQCEGITASFPSIVATVLLSAVIPLISLSIILVLMTNILLSRYFIKGERVRILERIWAIPSRGYFTAIVAVFLPLEILFIVMSVYLGYFRNLTVFSAINISMFVYGILFYHAITRILGFRINIPAYVEYIIIAVSTLLMFIWYIPTLTTDSVTVVSYFIIMGFSSLIAGAISGLLFQNVNARHRLLYFQYLTMMISTLAIAVFYISVIALHVIWPFFGMAEQIEFSLVIWGISLPFVWLGTNISLNSESSGFVPVTPHIENGIRESS
ncbi:MAG: hypothetical protein QXN26_00655 [Thermoplasmataceae archaeon]